MSLLYYPIFFGKVTELNLSGKKQIINTINPHSYCIAKKDKQFEEALKNSDILLADGIGIVLALKLLLNKKIDKIAGNDIHEKLLNEANNNNKRIFYLGSSENTLINIKNRLSREFPKLEVEFYSPPFKHIFSEEDNNKMIDSINNFEPDILFVGMTAPKQEKWVYVNKYKINASTICSIGAVFDFYAGTINRPPKWLIKIGLEWLGRLIKEPKRMWKRNFVSMPIFLFDILKEKLITIFKNMPE